MARLGRRDWRQRTALLRREALAGNVGAMVDLGLLLQEGLQDARGRAIVRAIRERGSASFFAPP